MANLSRQQVEQIIHNRPANTTPEQIVKGLLSQGHQLEGFSAAPSAQKENINYANVQKELEKPTITSDPEGWWKGLSNEDKQAILENSGEFVGGTAGAIGGGTVGPVGAIAGAGGGSVLGKSAGRRLGEALGYKKRTDSDLNRAINPLGDMSAGDAAKTFAVNAAGEGIGRVAVPLATHAGMAGIGNAIKPHLIGPQGRRLTAMAAQQGVPVTLPMVSENPIVKMADPILEMMPGGSGPIRAARQAGQRGFERNLESVASQIHPTPVSNEAVGEGVQDSLKAVRAGSKAYFDPQYKAISQLAGDARIDLRGLKDAAIDLNANLPADADRFFPQGTLAKIRQLATVGDEAAAQATAAWKANQDPVADQISYFISGGKVSEYSQLPPALKPRVDAELVRAGHKPPVPPPPPPIPEMSFDEARQLRTALLEGERSLRRGDPAINRSSIPVVRNALDGVIDRSLASSTRPQDAQALKQWRAMNTEYRSTHLSTDPPARPGGPGNPTTATIERSNYPEKLPQQLTATKGAYNDTQEALLGSPGHGAWSNLPPGTPSPTDSINQLRRAYVQELIDKSKVEMPTIGDDRFVSARTLDKNLAKEGEVAPAVLGPGPEQALNEGVEVGRAVSSPENLFGNTSRTARNLHNLRTAAKIGAAGAGVLGVYNEKDKPYSEILRDAAMVGAGLAAPRLAAKALTNPALVGKVLTRTPLMGAPLSGVKGAVAGAIGRMGAEASGFDETPTPEQQSSGMPPQPAMATQAPPPPAPGIGITNYSVTDPTGGVHHFADQAAADAFKREAQIQ